MTSGGRSAVADQHIAGSCSASSGASGSLQRRGQTQAPELPDRPVNPQIKSGEGNDTYERQIYNALPISNDALDRGGVELLRAAVVDEELLVAARRAAFVRPAPWGWVLADIARRLASLYAVGGDFTEAKATAAIVDEFARSFRGSGARTARHPSPRTREGREVAKAAKSARPRAKTQVQSRAKPKPSTRAAARRKGVRAKP
jgi:Domain of unknown function (DUF5076)